jgi:hypothetical protein
VAAASAGGDCDHVAAAAAAHASTLGSAHLLTIVAMRGAAASAYVPASALSAGPAILTQRETHKQTQTRHTYRHTHEHAYTQMHPVSVSAMATLGVYVCGPCLHV